MTIAEFLLKIVNPAYLSIASNDSLLQIAENNPANKYCAHIKNAPAGSALIKMDDSAIRRGLIKRGHWKKIADYAIVNDDGVIILELKSGNRVGVRDLHRQFAGAKCILDYLASIGRHFFNDDGILGPALDNQSCILIRVRKNNIRKQLSRREQHGYNDAFKRIHCADGDTIYYKQLVS